MAHRVAARAEADLDEIWLYVAKEGGSIEIANRLIDTITGRFFVLAGFPYDLGSCRKRAKCQLDLQAAEKSPCL